eukprot:224027-Chlamydomonas_euryale.AAC.1
MPVLIPKLSAEPPCPCSHPTLGVATAGRLSGRGTRVGAYHLKAAAPSSSGNTTALPGGVGGGGCGEWRTVWQVPEGVASGG